MRGGATGRRATTRAETLPTAAAQAAITGWSDFLSGGESTSSDAYDTWFESPGFWLCTSGSTGQPKLAAHRHGDIRVTCETYADQVLGVVEDDRFFSVGPMFHAYGLGNSLTFPFSVGATTILEPTRPPSPQLVADIVTAHRPTLFFCIPTFYAALNGSDLTSTCRTRRTRSAVAPAVFPSPATR